MSAVLRRTLIVLVALMGSITLTGCGGGSPDAVVKDFFNYLSDGKTDKAKALLHFKGGKAPEEADMMLGKMSGMVKASGGVKSIDISDTKTEGDKSTVKGKVTFGNGKSQDFSIPLVNDGGWKISDID